MSAFGLLRSLKGADDLRQIQSQTELAVYILLLLEEQFRPVAISERKRQIDASGDGDHQLQLGVILPLLLFK